MMGGPREVALSVLDAVSRRGLAAGPALARALGGSRLGPVDRALATELTNGVLRHRLYLDAVLDPVAARGLESLDPVTLNILRLGAYQLLFLDRVPAHAAVNETVNLARRRRGGSRRAGLVNAVLRRLGGEGPRPRVPSFDDDPAGHLSVVHSYPRWLVERWIGRLGAPGAARLLEASNRPPGITLRTNTLKTDPKSLADRLREEGVSVTPGRWVPEALIARSSLRPGELGSFREGLFAVQDEASMLVSRVLDPPPGGSVLDACAAPGGKTTHLAQLMGDRGRIVAMDRSGARLDMVREACLRMGIGSVEVHRGDARDGAAPGGPFDRVLVDAPCSGLGVIRRRPDIKWRRGEGDPEAMSRVQAEILEAVSNLVTPGGVLVYAVCSTEPEETTQVVANFTARAAGKFAPCDLSLRLPDGLRDEPGVGEGRLVLMPHLHDTDGFFVARWVRRFPGGGADNGRCQGKDLL